MNMDIYAYFHSFSDTFACNQAKVSFNMLMGAMTFHWMDIIIYFN